VSSNSPRQRALAVSLLVLLTGSIATISRAATLEQETATRIDQIRAIKSGQSHETMETYNR
jgi:hypothetical protein